MEGHNSLCTQMAEAFQEETLLRKLARPQADAAAVFGGVDWQALLAPLLPGALAFPL